jgi:hypothetical protein
MPPANPGLQRLGNYSPGMAGLVQVAAAHSP